MKRICQVCRKKKGKSLGRCQGEEAIGKHHQECCLDKSSWKASQGYQVVQASEPKKERVEKMKKVAKRIQTTYRETEAKLASFPQDPEEWVETVFTYHPPNPEQKQAYAKIRSKAKELARVLLEECPLSKSKTIALDRLREAIMWANASIATKGTV